MEFQGKNKDNQYSYVRRDGQMNIHPYEWLSLSKEIKVKLICLAILENTKRARS